MPNKKEYPVIKPKSSVRATKRYRAKRGMKDVGKVLGKKG